MEGEDTGALSRALLRGVGPAPSPAPLGLPLELVEAAVSLYLAVGAQGEREFLRRASKDGSLLTGYAQLLMSHERSGPDEAAPTFQETSSQVTS